MSSKTSISTQIKLDASFPARHKKTIVFCCNQNYFAFAGHAADQIASIAETQEFDICICYGQQAVVLPQSLDALDIRLCHIDVGNVFEGLLLNKERTHDVNSRIAVPAAFAEDYDTILYLGSEIFIRGGDFNAPLSINTAPHCNASARDNSRELKRHDQAGQFEPRFARSFARFFKTHFPDTKQIKTGPQKLAQNSTKMIKMLFEHLVSARKTASYLARFPDALTVHR